MTDSAYMVFYAIEQEVRAYLCVGNVKSITAGTRDNTVQSIIAVKTFSSTGAWSLVKRPKTLGYHSWFLICQGIHGAIQTKNEENYPEIQGP